MTKQDVINEMRDLIAVEFEKAGRTPAAQWLVQELLKRHGRIEGPDKDFHVLAAFHFAQDVVKLALRRRAPSVESDEAEPTDRLTQMVLPGYEYLQVAYLIPRDGQQHLVAVAEMTDEEIEAKADEHQRLAKGNEQHAEELRRYKVERRRPSGAA